MTHQKGSEQRVHFAVGLWTVCPSYQDGRNNLKGKQNNKHKLHEREKENYFNCFSGFFAPVL